jgi:hypothetical protein
MTAVIILVRLAGPLSWYGFCKINLPCFHVNEHGRVRGHPRGGCSRSFGQNCGNKEHQQKNQPEYNSHRPYPPLKKADLQPGDQRYIYTLLFQKAMKLFPPKQ